MLLFDKQHQLYEMAQSSAKLYARNRIYVCTYSTEFGIDDNRRCGDVAEMCFVIKATTAELKFQNGKREKSQEAFSSPKRVRSLRVSQPMESTRLNPISARPTSSSDDDDDNGNDNNNNDADEDVVASSVAATAASAAAAAAAATAADDDHVVVGGKNDRAEGRGVKPTEAQLVASSINDSELSFDGHNSSFINDRALFKTEFNGLNHRLVSYMERVRRNEHLLAECGEAKRLLEKQLETLKSEHSKQVEIYSAEIDERVRMSVLAEQKELQLRKDVSRLQEELDQANGCLNKTRATQEQLERQLMKEKQRANASDRAASEASAELAKMSEDNQDLKSQNTQLKIENAKLQERVRFAAQELTMNENKMSAVEKELQYSSHDVAKKLAEQRERLESNALAKLEDLRRRYAQEADRVRREFDRKFQDTLRTYVTAEDHAALHTKSEANLNRAEQAEQQVAERDERIRKLRQEIADLTECHKQQIVEEKKRREKVNRRLLAQTRDIEEIRTELETYRKLLESLDIDDNGIPRTPSGAKRGRASFELASPSFHRSYLRKSEENTPATPEARKALLKKVLTPRRRTSSNGDDQPAACNDSERDCKVM